MKYVLKGDPETGKVDLPHLIVAQTYKCNYNCNGCNVIIGKPSLSLTKTALQGTIDQWVYYVAKNGGKGIFHFKGGEPLLFDDMFNTLSYAAHKGLFVFMTTNASLIGDRELGELERIFQKTEGQVIVSLDGSTNEVNNLSRQTDSYDKAIGAVREFRKRRIPFAINYKVHQGNQEDVEAGINLAGELEAEQFNLLPHTRIKEAVKKNNEIPDLEVILPQLEKAMNNGAKDMLKWNVADMIQRLGSGEYECNGCTAGFKGFAYITPEGNVYSCPNTVMEQHRLGTIDNSFEELFRNEKARELREIHKGRLICKGELEGYKTQPQSREKLEYEEQVIKQAIIKHATAKTENTKRNRKPVAVCFNRNF